MMYSVIYEKIAEPGFEGYYYAHIPSLGVTTYGIGVEGARKMAEDAITLLLEDMIAEGEPIPKDTNVLMSTIEISENTLHIA